VLSCTILLLLEFILANQGLAYFETEQDKVSFFCETKGVTKDFLPARVYHGRPGSQSTARYFVDKFPLFLAPPLADGSPVVTFSYVDSGFRTPSGFLAHLAAYQGLFRQLATFRFLYIAAKDAYFRFAEERFRSLVKRPLESAISAEIFRYFQIRRKWDNHEYVVPVTEDFEFLTDARRWFHGDRFDSLYQAWRSGDLLEPDLRVGISQLRILRTMQRVLSCSSKDKKPPFSQEGLAIPERDKLQMKIESRGALSFSWSQAKQIAGEVYKLDVDDVLKERYATLFILASASGLRCAELFALRINDQDFKAGTIRVDESADQRTYILGPCKNVAAYRTVLLADAEGREALLMLKRFLKGPQTQTSFVFRSKRGTALRETSVLHSFLHPVLRTLGFPQAGMHAFRHGCNRRWELPGMNPAVLRQQMGHSSAVMTARYTEEIPLEQVRTAFSSMELENMENGVSVLAVA